MVHPGDSPRLKIWGLIIMSVMSVAVQRLNHVCGIIKNEDLVAVEIGQFGNVDKQLKISTIPILHWGVYDILLKTWVSLGLS